MRMKFSSMLALLAAATMSVSALGQVYNDNVTPYRDGNVGRYGSDVADEELSDIEWDPTGGYHEEEWYDPSDWIDFDAGIEYEDTGVWGAGYGYDNYGYYDNNYNYTANDWNDSWYGESDWYGNDDEWGW